MLGKLWHGGVLVDHLDDGLLGGIVARANFHATRGETDVVAIPRARGRGMTVLLVGAGIPVLAEPRDRAPFQEAYNAEIARLRRERIELPRNLDVPPFRLPDPGPGKPAISVAERAINGDATALTVED